MNFHVVGHTLFLNGKRYRCAVGKGGFALPDAKREGDGCTPQGRFAMRECWARTDRLAMPQTLLPKRVISPSDGWCDDAGSPLYNRHITLSSAYDGDHKPSPSGRGLGEGYYEYAEPDLTAKAREMRHVATSPEQILWSALRNRQLGGHKFRRQHPIPPFIADFCCEELKLVIEIDGDTHASAQDRQKDAMRTAYLGDLGYHVVRFTNADVISNMQGVHEALTLTLSQRERGLGVSCHQLPRHEKLFRDDHVYDLIVPLGYNDNPVVAGLGSAIFMHLAKPDYAPTEGCVALALPDLLEILPHLSTDSVIEIRAE